ncbi:recombination protein, phage associated [Lysinibacillus capsici]|uniref:Recombination protein, phage associated n=1 Tax=Lysinibacillus capsici TaxID=2115968 RepID=A0A2X0Z9E0_9BACI|nr:ERF family protein [Lysinibacillus capsici]SPT99151.1 recombination protein, phage associated [Lysinibacillus capsici]
MEVINKSESIAELAKALSLFQGEVKQPLKDKANPFFKSKYVPLENVVEAITEIAPKHGLSFIQYPINQDNKVGVVTVLMHSSGEYIQMEPIFTTPAKNDAQATGSVITYLKRYSLSAVFGITSDEDDDGNSASTVDDKQKTTNNGGVEKLSAAQLKMITGKVAELSKINNESQNITFKNATKELGINKMSNQLTKQEAMKLIDYLTSKIGGKQ